MEITAGAEGPLCGGFPVPCLDDRCIDADVTLCGLRRDMDFCDHGLYPSTCEDCQVDFLIDDDREDES